MRRSIERVRAEKSGTIEMGRGQEKRRARGTPRRSLPPRALCARLCRYSHRRTRCRSATSRKCLSNCVTGQEFTDRVLPPEHFLLHPCSFFSLFSPPHLSSSYDRHQPRRACSPSFVLNVLALPYSIDRSSGSCTCKWLAN